MLNWLHKDVDFVKVYSFDLSKAFDFVSNQILCNKLKLYNMRMINFLSNHKQRVVVNSVTTKFVDIDRGVSQGTVLVPVLFSIMVNDSNVVNLETNLLIKFADDITLSNPIGPNLPDDSLVCEIQNIRLWSSMNRMKLNLTKIWKLVMRGKTPKTPSRTVPAIERKSELKMGVTFHENLCKWDTHSHYMMDKANSRLYILRICKYYRYTLEELTILFNKLCPYLHTKLKYRHALIVVNTFLRSINSASEHGNLAIARSACSSVM